MSDNKRKDVDGDSMALSIKKARTEDQQLVARENGNQQKQIILPPVRNLVSLCINFV